MKDRLLYAVNTVVTTFVIVFPAFILKNHPFYASTIGIVLAVLVNRMLNPDWRPWKYISKH